MTQHLKNLPRHVAIIMDGNGRWARQRGIPRIEGHRAGAESVREIVRVSGELGVDYLTLYAFSIENWNRPKTEVSGLMRLLEFYLKQEIAELNKHNVRLAAIGRIHELPASAQRQLEKSIDALNGSVQQLSQAGGHAAPAPVKPDAVAVAPVSTLAPPGLFAMPKVMSCEAVGTRLPYASWTTTLTAVMVLPATTSVGCTLNASLVALPADTENALLAGEVHAEAVAVSL